MKSRFILISHTIVDIRTEKSRKRWNMKQFVANVILQVDLNVILGSNLVDI